MTEKMNYGIMARSHFWGYFWGYIEKRVLIGSLFDNVVKMSVRVP